MKFLRLLMGRTAAEPARPAVPSDAQADPVIAALAELEVKRLREALAAVTPPPSPSPSAVEPDPQSSPRPSRVVKAKAPRSEGSRPVMNIWDMEEAAARGTNPPPATPGAEGERRRPARNKTRILAFDIQSAEVAPLFEDPGQAPAAAAPAAAPAEPGLGHVMFPAGWLVVKEGPGQGAAFALVGGISQIGRGADQTVALSFGDMTISRQNHATIAYDPATHLFHLTHGGKSNLVRLNGRPLLSTEPLVDGDEIQIGETTLLLKVLCSPDFNWSSAKKEGDAHDMAIA